MKILSEKLRACLTGMLMLGALGSMILLTVSTAFAGPLKPVGLETFATGLGVPTAGAATDRHPDHLYVTGQQGKITAINLTNKSSATILDLTTVVPLIPVNELGLLGIAFHPEFSVNGKFYTMSSEVNLGSATDFKAKYGTNLPSFLAGVGLDVDNVLRE